MGEEKKIAMILAIVEEIDYDIYKGVYNKDTAEEPELVEDNINDLLAIVNEHMEPE